MPELVLYGIRLLAQATLRSFHPMRAEPRRSSTNGIGELCEQENWRPGAFSLATLNYGSLVSTRSLQEIFFSDQHFGNHRADLLASVSQAASQHQPD